MFELLWVPDPNQKPGDRLAYLQLHRGELHRNVAFQALFLMALGRLGFEMGRKANWAAEHEVLAKLDKVLSPNTIDYDAVRIVLAGTKEAFAAKEAPAMVLQKVDRWANAMMKQALDEHGNVIGYAFNNTRENVDATFNVLCKLAEFEPLPAEKKGAPDEFAEI